MLITLITFNFTLEQPDRIFGSRFTLIMMYTCSTKCENSNIILNIIRVI